MEIKGKYRDILKGPDNRVILDTGWRSNTIVHGCKMMIAAMMKNDSPQGVQYLKVGQGDQTWDVTTSTASEDALDLVSPYRIVIPQHELKMVYLKEDKSRTVSSEITNVLQITATLAHGFPEPITDSNFYPLREFGLFGRCGSKDYMINCVRHQVINKDVAATLIREIQLYF